MRRLGQIGFILLNVIVSLVVVLVVISITNSGRAPEQDQIVITVPVLITATPNPNQFTQTPWLITTTPLPGTPRIGALPTGIIDATFDPNAPTIDPALLESSELLQATAGTPLPENCVLYEIQEGDTPFGIAEQYGVDGFELMAVNGLDDVSASLLQVGQTLIVPLAGCEMTAQALAATEAATIQPTATITPTEGTPPSATVPPSVTPSPTNTPTSTLPPTAVNAQVAILRVIGAGDITTEGVEIQNNGAVVDLSGWTLTDGGENTYTFADQRFFTNGRLVVYTRTGTDTPSAKYWNRDTAVWVRGATLALQDREGRVQSTFRVP
jgi:LysM repeat protein